MITKVLCGSASASRCCLDVPQRALRKCLSVPCLRTPCTERGDHHYLWPCSNSLGDNDPFELFTEMSNAIFGLLRLKRGV